MKQPFSGLFSMNALKNNYLSACIVTALLIFCSSLSAQIFDSTRKLQLVGGDGFIWKSGEFSGKMKAPSGLATLSSKDSGAMSFSNGSMYFYNGQIWNKIGTGTGSNTTAAGAPDSSYFRIVNTTGKNYRFQAIGVANSNITYLQPSDTVNRYPRLIAGTNISIIGTYPNQTISAASGSTAFDSTTIYRVLNNKLNYTDTTSELSAYKNAISNISVNITNNLAKNVTDSNTLRNLINARVTGVTGNFPVMVSGTFAPIISIDTTTTASVQTKYRTDSARNNIYLAIAAKGRIDSVSLVNNNLLHGTATVNISNKVATITQALLNQNAYTLLGRGSGIGLPTFLSSIDSNYAPSLATQNFVNNSLSAKLNSSLAASTYQPIGSYLTASSITGKVNYSDTTSILSNYQNALNTHTTQIASKENSLGNPSTNGYVLSSTTTGTRAWVAPATGGGGTVTSVSANAPLSISGGGTISPTVIADTTSSVGFQTKFRSDTARNAIYSSIATKLNTSTATTIYQPIGTYLQPADSVNKAVRLLAGSNIGITGSYPNLTISSAASVLDTTSATAVQTKFRSDTARINTYSNLAGKQVSLGFTPYNATNPNGYISSYTETDPIVKAINGIVKSNGTVISAATAGTDYLTPSGSAASLTGFPTFNQSTTGNALTATNLTGLTTSVTTLNNQSGTNTGDNSTNSLYSGLVTNQTHTGDATGSTALTVKGINGTLLSGLATGILKITTATGVPSIAIASDFPALPYQTPLTSGSNIQTINGSTILAGTNRQLIIPSDTAFLDGQVLGHTTQIAGKENGLGNPSTNGYVLSSTTAGTRSWIAPATGGGTGTVTSVSANAPLSVTGSATVTPTIVADTTTTVGFQTKFRADSARVNIYTNIAGKQTTLGFTPYNATNPSGYISAYTETDPIVKAVNGIVKSNGTTISAAVAGDFPALPYQAPLTSGTNIQTINGTTILAGTNRQLIVPTDTAFASSQIALKGRIDSVSFVNNSLIHNAATVVISNKVATITQTLTSQSPFTLLGRGTGTGVPSFLAAIDSNYAPTLATQNYVNARATQFTNITGGINFVGGFLGIGNATPNKDIDVVRNYSGSSSISITNTSATSGAVARFVMLNGTSNSEFGKYGTVKSSYKNISANDFDLYNTGGNISILNDVSTGNINFATGTASAAQMTLNPDGSLLLALGGKMKITTGTNASVGTATLVAGTVTVATTAAVTASLIFVTVTTGGGTRGFLSVPTITNATSFVISSTSATETSVVNWWIIN